MSSVAKMAQRPGAQGPPQRGEDPRVRDLQRDDLRGLRVGARRKELSSAKTFLNTSKHDMKLKYVLMNSQRVCDRKIGIDAPENGLVQVRDRKSASG